MTPDAPQVLYRLYASDDRLLYIGIAQNVTARLAAHARAKDWWTQVTTIRLEHYASREDVATAERRAIVAEEPERNITHRPCTTPDQIKMRRRLRRNAATRKRTANHEAELIREARRLNVRWQDIADDLDRSREHVRLAADPQKRP